MIWSIIPEEFIFAGSEPELQAPGQRQYLGRQVLVSSGRIVGLLSTNPADYLDARLAPGAELLEGQQ